MEVFYEKGMELINSGKASSALVKDEISKNRRERKPVNVVLTILKKIIKIGRR